MLLAFALLVLYLTHLFHLGTLPLMGADEPRYARVGEEMWRSRDYVTPTLSGAPWLEKPPLLYWFEAGAYSVAGVSEWSARLGSSLVSLAAMAMAALLLLRLGRRRAAFLVVLIVPTAPLYAAFARSATTDMPLTACLSISLMAAFLAARERALGWSCLCGVALGLATLAKGPVAPVLFVGIMGVYSLLSGRLLWTWRQLGLAAGLALLVAAPWFWLVWRANGYDFLATFVLNHHIARYLTPVHRHSQPFWFYGAVILAGFFPWVFLLGSALVRLRHRVGNWQWDPLPLEPLLWLWVVMPLLFFSLSESKLAGYILPVFPALGLLCALEWDRYLEGDVTKARWIGRELTVVIVVGVGMCVGLVVGSLISYQAGWPGLVLALPIAAGCLAGWRERRHRRSAGILVSLVAAMTVFIALAYSVAAPVAGPFHSVRELALQARPHIGAREPLIQYRIFHHSALYYTDYQATRDAIGSMVQLSGYFAAFPQQRYYLLVKSDGLRDLVHQLGELESVTRSGPFYLVVYEP